MVDFEPKLKWDLIVILNNISWIHILLSEENNVVYSFAQIELEMNEKIGSQVTLLKRCYLDFQFELCPFMKRCCLDFHFELCPFILSCVFKMVTIWKVAKRSINTQVHCHSEG